MTADLATVLLAEDDRHDGQGYYQTGAAVSLDDVAETFSTILISQRAIAVGRFWAVSRARLAMDFDDRV